MTQGLFINSNQIQVNRYVNGKESVNGTRVPSLTSLRTLCKRQKTDYLLLCREGSPRVTQDSNPLTTVSTLLTVNFRGRRKL